MEHSAILLTFIKLLYGIKIFVVFFLVFFLGGGGAEWQLHRFYLF